MQRWGGTAHVARVTGEQMKNEKRVKRAHHAYGYLKCLRLDLHIEILRRRRRRRQQDRCWNVTPIDILSLFARAILRNNNNARAMSVFPDRRQCELKLNSLTRRTRTKKYTLFSHVTRSSSQFVYSKWIYSKCFLFYYLRRTVVCMWAFPITIYSVAHTHTLDVPVSRAEIMLNIVSSLN